MISYVFAGGEWGKVKFESKLHNTSLEQNSQAINSKKVCEHYLLHQTDMKFSLGMLVTKLLQL